MSKLPSISRTELQGSTRRSSSQAIHHDERSPANESNMTMNQSELAMEYHERIYRRRQENPDEPYIPPVVGRDGIRAFMGRIHFLCKERKCPMCGSDASHPELERNDTWRSTSFICPECRNEKCGGIACNCYVNELDTDTEIAEIGAAREVVHNAMAASKATAVRVAVGADAPGSAANPMMLGGVPTVLNLFETSSNLTPPGLPSTALLANAAESVIACTTLISTPGLTSGRPVPTEVESYASAGPMEAGSGITEPYMQEGFGVNFSKRAEVRAETQQLANKGSAACGTNIKTTGIAEGVTSCRRSIIDDEGDTFAAAVTAPSGVEDVAPVAIPASQQDSHSSDDDIVEPGSVDFEMFQNVMPLTPWPKIGKVMPLSKSITAGTSVETELPIQSKHQSSAGSNAPMRMVDIPFSLAYLPSVPEAREADPVPEAEMSSSKMLI